MTAQDVFRDTLKLLAPDLKERGFKKARHKFVRPGRETIALIEFQSSRSSDADDLSYVINLGVIAIAIFRGRDLRRPAWTECHWLERVSDPSGREIWWGVRDVHSPDEVAARIRRVLAEQAFPGVDTFQTEADFIALWSSGGGSGLSEGMRLESLAKLLHRAGRRDEFAQTLGQLEAMRSDPFTERALAELRSLG